MDYKLKNRYIFEGKIIMETGLHIGGGLPDPRTDNTVLRTIDGKPFIPGSSFKGAFRSAVERIVPIEKIRTCRFALKSDYDCITVNEDLQKEYSELKKTKKFYLITQEILKNLSIDIDNTLIDKIFSKTKFEKELNKLNIEKNIIDIILDKCEFPWNNKTNMEYLNAHLCNTCKLFGSPYTAGRVFFSDLYLDEEFSSFKETEIRDGVVIDRDSERAFPKLKYDYEVVPAGIVFKFTITLENASDEELGIIATGIQEFKNGMIPLGGIKTRGLGRCNLKDLQIRYINFEDNQQLKNYLISGSLENENSDNFLSDKISILFPEEVNV